MPQHTILARTLITRQVDGVDTDILANQEISRPEPVAPAKMEETLSELSANTLEEYSGNI